MLHSHQEQEAPPRLSRPGGHNWAASGCLFGTILAHLLPQNATRQHARTPLSHCVYRWQGVPVGVTLGLLIRWSTVRFRHAHKSVNKLGSVYSDHAEPFVWFLSGRGCSNADPVLQAALTSASGLTPQ